LAFYTIEERKQKINSRTINYNIEESQYGHYRKTVDSNAMQRAKIRKNIKQQNAQKAKSFMVFFFVFSLLMPKIFFDNLNNYFIKRIHNQNIEIPKDLSFINKTESYFAENADFLDAKILENANADDSLMKEPFLRGEMPSLKNQLLGLANRYPKIKPGVFVWDYNTGKYVDINADKVFPTASIIKLPVMYQVFRRAEKGLIDLNDRMSLTSYYVSGGSGSLQYSPIGTSLSVRRLANRMIQESDNSATNMLLSSVGGMNELNREMKRWGLKNTSFSEWLPDLNGTNVSTPKEMGTLLYNISNSDLLSIQSKAEIINIMSHVRNRNLIQAGLPDSARFIHKTGDIGHMLGDAGVVALPDGRKYIVVMMVERPWNSFLAKQFIIDASKTIYNYYMSGNP
jgi:beta-lactamase class A